MKHIAHTSNRSKRFWRFVFAAIGALGGLGLLGYLAAWLIGMVLGGISFSLPASSIGIIGGADGPTSVFVTATAGPAWELLICVFLLVAGIIGWRRLNKAIR